MTAAKLDFHHHCTSVPPGRGSLPPARLLLQIVVQPHSPLCPIPAAHPGRSVSLAKHALICLQPETRRSLSLSLSLSSYVGLEHLDVTFRAPKPQGCIAQFAGCIHNESQHFFAGSQNQNTVNYSIHACSQLLSCLAVGIATIWPSRSLASKARMLGLPCYARPTWKVHKKLSSF